MGRHDNFFGLGGHSLLAVQAKNLLKREAIDASVTELFAYPDVARLAEHIIQREGGIVDDGIILFSTKGVQPPLFLIYEVSGEVMYARELVRNIDLDAPIYGLSVGTEYSSPARTLEGMAARLVQTIRRVQPVGPYRLAGWSFGGLLAYEIASQLIGADETVEFLGLLDTRHATSLLPAAFETDDAVMLKWLATRMASSTVLPAVEEEVADFVALVRLYQEHSLIPANLTRGEISAYMARMRCNLRAIPNYRGHALPITVHLFAAAEGMVDDPLLGWGTVLPQEQIRVNSTPGTHATMIEPPHVVVLATALSQAIADAAEQIARMPEADYDPLVTIQHGRRNVEPLFCMAGAGGNTVNFTELASALGSDRPVYGLQPRGLDGMLVPHSTVSAAAQAYIKAIDGMKQDGLVHLLGHSFGGWVAFDMALQLRAIGRNIASLTIADSRVPDSGDVPEREHTSLDAFMQLISIFEQAAECPLELSMSDIEPLGREAREQLLHQRLEDVGLVSPRSMLYMLGGPVRTFEASLRTHYCPLGVYPGPINLVLAKKPDLSEDENKCCMEEIATGWRRWAPNLTLYSTTGNHMTMLKTPHVNILATSLQKPQSDR